MDQKNKLMLINYYVIIKKGFTNITVLKTKDNV